jgi:hypothetical protein
VKNTSIITTNKDSAEDTYDTTRRDSTPSFLSLPSDPLYFFPDWFLLLVTSWVGTGEDNNKLPKMVLEVLYQHSWVMRM